MDQRLRSGGDKRGYYLYMSLGHSNPNIIRNVNIGVSKYWDTHPAAQQRVEM